MQEESAEGQKWAEASGNGEYLVKRNDGQLIFGGAVRGEWGVEIKQWKMHRA